MFKSWWFIRVVRCGPQLRRSGGCGRNLGGPESFRKDDGNPEGAVYHVFMLGGWPFFTLIKTRVRRWRRSRLKRKYPRLFRETSALLFRFDPIGINFEDNTDEYEPEVGTILPRLPHCHSSVDTRRVVFEEFCKWFGPETAGDEMKYDVIAEELWVLWSADRASSGFKPIA